MTRAGIRAVVQASGDGVAIRTGQISNSEQDRITEACNEAVLASRSRC